MTSSGKRPDLIIIGGGIIGSAIAYYAAKAGLRPIVLEPLKAGGRASTVAAGLIAPSPQLTKDTSFSRIALASVSLFPGLQEELLDASGIDIELRACGTLRIATTEAQAKNQQRRLPKQQALGLELNWLQPEEVGEIEPSLTKEVFGAVYGPSESQVNASRLLAAYVAGALRYGAKFQTTAAHSFFIRGSQVQGVITKAQTFHAQHTVIATGAWAPLVGAWLQCSVPIYPERGQLVTVRGTYPQPQHIIFGEQIYIAPKAHGRLVIGSIKDNAGYNQGTTVAALVELLTKGVQVVPGIASASPGSASAGLRPRTPDGCPIIGPLPGWEGVSMAAGHNSNGILLSAITGQIITAQLTGGGEPISSGPYLLDRFLSDSDKKTA